MIKIFKIVNKEENKFYIGKAKNIIKKFDEIKKSGCRGYEKLKNKKLGIIENNGLYEDMKRLGLDKFHFEIIDTTKNRILADLKIKNFIVMNLKRMKSYNDYGVNYEIKYKRKVCKLDLDKNLIEKYESSYETVKDGYIHNKVSKACVEICGFHKGFLWIYEDDYIYLKKIKKLYFL